MGEKMGLDCHLRPFHLPVFFRYRRDYRRGNAYACLEVFPRYLAGKDGNIRHGSLPGIGGDKSITLVKRRLGAPPDPKNKHSTDDEIDNTHYQHEGITGIILCS